MSQIQVFGSGSGAGSHPVGSGTHCIYIRFVFRRHGHDLLHVADIHETHVTLWDLGEVDENFSDDDAEGVTLSLQVTIFSESDEVELAREIKKLMKEKGFSFEGRNGDDSKPEDGIYMKAQRFSKFYEMEE